MKKEKHWTLVTMAKITAIVTFFSTISACGGDYFQDGKNEPANKTP
ncbi:MAG: hypothetical protein Q4B18_03715 [Bacillota bacterium]|nr:hypothetical protein [Bacillota bacterium]